MDNSEDDYESDQRETTDDELVYDSPESIGEKFGDKAILELLLDTEILLKNLQRNMEGLEEINGEFIQVRLPIARDEVIAFVINSLRSIINPSSSFSYIEVDQARNSTYEKILEFEYMAVEELTIDAKDQETLINMCDHSLELFYGKVIEGHLTTALKDIFSGTHTKPEIKQDNGFFSLKNMFGGMKN
jgi:hypothetical protein